MATSAAARGAIVSAAPSSGSSRAEAGPVAGREAGALAVPVRSPVAGLGLGFAPLAGLGGGAAPAGGEVAVPAETAAAVLAAAAASGSGLRLRSSATKKPPVS